MVFQDGYFYQGRLFYSTKWTRPMEATFVAALVEHKKQGHFKRNGINFHAERVLCKCYVNAYEDFYESLCILFGPDTPDQPNLMYEEEKVDSVMAFYPPSDWVDEIPYAFGQNIMLPHINQLQNMSVETTSLCLFLEEYYPSEDEEEVNSILALLAAPPPSPDPSYVSVEHISSSASNEISKSN
ncbi:hypothetical protein Salat_2583000 [Sesamum alatum]|uniref:Uncharacterized protein n=1 Tax=Sesamum alatum TaxID=300844 RepID=A0AAE1XMT9_9LAMI|nr:hypothetical protein Salat_2583000 [Sesamum alatum]